MNPTADAYRRWWGAFCLIVAGGMLIWGQTVLEPHLQGLGFLLFWVVCFGFTCAALVIAMLDLRSIRRQSRQARRELLREALEDLTPEQIEVLRLHQRSSSNTKKDAPAKTPARTSTQEVTDE